MLFDNAEKRKKGGQKREGDQGQQDSKVGNITGDRLSQMIIYYVLKSRSQGEKAPASCRREGEKSEKNVPDNFGRLSLRDRKPS